MQRADGNIRPLFSNARDCHRRHIMTLVEDTWERESQNAAPGTTLNQDMRHARSAFGQNTSSFEALDIVAAVLATAMLLGPLMATTVGW
jgi:hypothetical protein